MAKKPAKEKEENKRPTTPLPVGAFTEWTDVGGLAQLFGLRKGTAYGLINNEPALADASISLKKPGESRGKRLFNVAKFRAYLESKLIA